MGIQGLLQALKPYVEPVHVNKYSGQRVGIDAYSWLHKGAYGCSWQQLREADTRQNSERLPPYVMYCMHRIKMLQYNNITPVVVFDGGRLPLKALTEQIRRRSREENLQKAHQKLAEGNILSAQEHFQKAVEITPQMAHELVKVLRDARVEYVVAPYEADAQLAHLARLAPEDGGVATIITEDSDLLAYGCKVVLFKMDKFGNGEELRLEKILHSQQIPVTGISFRNFTQDLFLAMCVLAGCDFLASIPGIGVKKAHALLAKYRNIHRVLNRLKVSKHSEFPEGYITNFWQAKAIFTHARVYARETRSLILLNPLPDELLKEFDGDTDFLGPDLPQSRARAIAEGQLDPTTMCSFQALTHKKPAAPFVLTTPNVERIGTSKMEIFSNPQVQLSQSLPGISKGSQVSLGSRQSLQSIPNRGRTSQENDFDVPEGFAIQKMWIEPGCASQSTIISGTPPAVDQKLLAELQFIAYSGSHQEMGSQATTYTQVNSLNVNESGQGHELPTNNPFRQQQCEKNTAHLDILSSLHGIRGKLEFTGDSSGLSIRRSVSSLCSPADKSQDLSSSGEAMTEAALIQSVASGLTSVDWNSSSPLSSEPSLARCNITEQGQYNENFDEMEGLAVIAPSNINQASQSSTCASVLKDISPNRFVVPTMYDHSLSKTPSSVSPARSRNPSQSCGKMGVTKNAIQLSKSKSASRVHRTSIGAKRSRADSLPQSRSGREAGILRFFKPVPTPTKLAGIVNEWYELE